MNQTNFPTEDTPSLLERGQGGEVLAVGEINRVQQSSLVTFNLEEFFTPGERVYFDLKPYLFQETILREKEFREKLKQTDWSIFSNKHVAIGCTADAIIPIWAHMLVALQLQPVAATIVFGTIHDLEIDLFKSALKPVNWQSFAGAKVVVKGCSKVAVPEAVYVYVATKLRSVAFSIMFGEPCSTVPLFKAPRP